MRPDTVALPLAPMEVVGLSDLVAQLRSLWDDSSSSDPAIARLSPDAYPDDPVASREFRRLTEGDQATRRNQDAQVVADGLAKVVSDAAADSDDEVVVNLTASEVGSWMRTLAAMRLVIATRLGVDAGGDPDPSDPAYGIYEWLAYRLETLIELTDD